MSQRSLLHLSSAVAATTLALATLPVHAAPDAAALAPQLRGSLDKFYPQIEAIYKDIHANPELGFQETRTAAKLASEMRALGFEVTEHVGKTGVVALLEERRWPDGAGAHRARRAADGREDRPALRQQGEGGLERARDLRRPQLRPRHPHGSLAGDRAASG